MTPNYDHGIFGKVFDVVVNDCGIRDYPIFGDDETFGGICIAYTERFG